MGKEIQDVQSKYKEAKKNVAAMLANA